MKIWCICSGGGHLTELLEVVYNLKKYKLVLVTYYGKNNILPNNIFSVHYSVTYYKTNFLKFFVDLFQLILKFFREKPEFMISTGGELSIPFFYFGKIFLGSKLIYIECSAKVYTPSITGRLLYPVTNLFLVQWKSLLKKYGKKARYVGGLI